MSTPLPLRLLEPPDKPAGLILVQKPAGWTSHDVVARIRKLAHTRKVGHAGTLDPMATGVLLVGINRATRLLGFLQLEDKEYVATMRLGQTTSTDDSDGHILDEADTSGLTEAAIRSVIRRFIGEFQQVPSSVSAIKVDGRRAYDRVRSGETVELAARTVNVSAFELIDCHVDERWHDVKVRVACSSGTYVRALARDIGQQLGVGGHLTALDRKRIGSFSHGDASSLEHLAVSLNYAHLDDVVRHVFAVRELTVSEAERVSHGAAIDAADTPGDGPVALCGPDGKFLALYKRHGQMAKAVAVFV